MEHNASSYSYLNLTCSTKLFLTLSYIYMQLHRDMGTNKEIYVYIENISNKVWK